MALITNAEAVPCTADCTVFA